MRAVHPIGTPLQKVSPQPVSSSAPPVYRPAAMPVQAKMGPPVYQPEATARAAHGSAPAVYRPATPATMQRRPAPQAYIPARPPAVQAARSSIVQPFPVHIPERQGQVVQPSFEKYQQVLKDKGFLSPKAAKRLQDGQAAILKTRAKLGAGAGNITQQVVKSRGISFVNTNFVKEVGQEYTKSGIDGIAAWAIAARRGQAGNCDEFAAVTYFYLLEMNTGDDISVVGLPQVGHHFVLIGDVNNTGTDEAVVVDPWPAKGYAVLHAHWQYKNETMKTTLGPTRSQGQTPLKSARAKLNMAGHTRKAFEGGLKRAFAQYGTGEAMRSHINDVNQNTEYLWGNEHTVSDAFRQRMKQYFENRRKAVTDPLSLDDAEFQAIYQ